MNRKIRVFLTDDHTLLRNALTMLLEGQEDMEVVGEAASGCECLEGVKHKKPDVVLMDISLPDCDGVEATGKILTALPETRVIAVTMHVEDEYLLRFLNAGGRGYVHKSAADRELIKAIHTVVKGDVFLSATGVQVMANQYCSTESVSEVTPDILSDRELQVLQFLARGFTSREIGEKLFLSPRTIETYRERITVKLKLEHRSDLVDYAIRYKLLG
ncbi:response regulator containing a CheY-like receiver domain and an HTH DNA-binding domain [Desulfitobacterium dichloroeliminans LMG P-21439]|uniref:Stage 0 sporulation protein A homolog n=1 Tax=Desulfitobacterium dichloroeliminans (strain LMG P-21439 / DCA1) TaxID=871963 RepID=L0FAU4_DESDL|nr:response regulator transcription factor [Desulfitobacterium dichloroeliminans]AGA70347.1 response regulator containing a CheY-like receiver domain and an HTH DNA-binding domain [Desulfitobacterium dichloroeliminans LMG P-21439]